MRTNHTSLYVPVLRSHAAERRAIRELPQDVRRITAPLIEISVDTARKMRTASIAQVARDLHEMAAGTGEGEVYMDLGRLMDQSDFVAICREFDRRLLATHCGVRLVLRPADISNPQGLVPLDGILRRNGAALRVTPPDYSNPALAGVTPFLRRHGLDPSETDLVVDCQVVTTGQRMATATMLETRLPWRSITYVGGSFPPNLVELDKNNQYELPRCEWGCFTSEPQPQRHNLRYGDYTVQHPFQADPPLKVLPSGSIRYTSNTYWVVMRGEKLDNPNGPGHQQYIAQAQLLCERPEFCGAEFSAGDAYIALIAGGAAGTGKPETWIQAGVNHHVTFAARQVASLFAA